MLEAAGFSRSNPYNIVPQGKVMLLTTMKDEHRLDLIKDIAGTRLYDMRRDEVHSFAANLQTISESRICMTPQKSFCIKLQRTPHILISMHMFTWDIDCHSRLIEMPHKIYTDGSKKQALRLIFSHTARTFFSR